MGQQSPLQVKALTKRYGSARGVEDLSFELEQGEVFGYLGPNGSGKTTTIRCLMGLLRPTRGECFIAGRRVRHGKATAHERIGYLPGDFQTWSDCSGRRSLHMLAALGSRQTNGRCRELAERLDIDLDRRVGNLSKGNRQKIGIIYAFQHEPDILILDEPTSGLDPLMRQVVLELIREATEAGATVLLSSHDLSEVSAVCQRAAILREGRLVELAPISQIVQQGERRLKAWLKPGTPVPALPSEGLPGVRLVQSGSGVLHLAYHGSADAVLKWLAQFPVDRLATPQTSLEEAFIHYYRKGRRQPEVNDA